jgi:hypothetical protein
MQLASIVSMRRAPPDDKRELQIARWKILPAIYADFERI